MPKRNVSETLELEKRPWANTVFLDNGDISGLNCCINCPFFKYLSPHKSRALENQKQQIHTKKKKNCQNVHSQHRGEKQPGAELVIYFLFIFISFSLHNKRQEQWMWTAEKNSTRTAHRGTAIFYIRKKSELLKSGEAERDAG